MKTAKKLYLGSFFRTSEGLIRIAVAFFMMPFIVGKLGDDWYGIWVLVGSLGGYFYLVDFGLSSAVSRYVAYHLAREEKKETNTVINTSFGIYCLMALAIMVLTGILALLVGYFVVDSGKLQIVRTVLLIAGFQTALQFPFKAFVGIVQAKIRYDLLTASHLTTLVLGATAIWYFLSQGYGIMALAWIGFATSQLSNILFFLIARYLFRDMMVGFSFFSRGKVRELFGYSLWSFIIQIADQLRHKVDALVIAALLSPVHVAHYFIGARLVEYFNDLIYRATNMVTPILTAYQARNDLKEMRHKVLLLSRINVILAVFGGGMIIALGDTFIELWMGAVYLDAYPVMVVLMLAIMVNFIMNPSVSAMFAMAKHRYLAWIHLAEGFANLGLSILLIPKFGILGCAFGTAIPLLVNRLFIIPAYACRQMGLGLREFYGDLLPTAGFAFLYVLSANEVIAYLEMPASYSGLLMAFLLSCPLYMAAILFISFSKKERGLIFSILPEKLAASVGVK
jgi:O-antigen/teichoic acid export membrane protein